MTIKGRKSSKARITKRRSALFISGFLVLLCILITQTYRPFIYENHLNDLHFADTITSWICIPAASLFFWGVSHARFLKCLVGSLIGFLIYECIGLTFDWFDIMALFSSAVITYSIYTFYNKKHFF